MVRLVVGLRMGWSPGDVGGLWCGKPVEEYDAGSWGVSDCCREHVGLSPHA